MVMRKANDQQYLAGKIRAILSTLMDADVCYLEWSSYRRPCPLDEVERQRRVWELEADC